MHRVETIFEDPNALARKLDDLHNEGRIIVAVIHKSYPNSLQTYYTIVSRKAEN